MGAASDGRITFYFGTEKYLEWHLAIMCRDASKRIRFGQCFRKVRFVVVCRLELYRDGR